MMQWLDQPIPFVRRSGRVEEAEFVALVSDYHTDPVVAVACGHVVLQLGFELLSSHLLQLACPPAEAPEWAEWLLQPPSPEVLAKMLAPLRPALMLGGCETPFLQVKPLADWTSEPLPLAGLLPDSPSETAIANDQDFFVKRGNYGAVRAGLVAPLLYAATTLFPAAGGGYFSIPHGAGSTKYQIVGRTLWETLWLNVRGLDSWDLRDAPWPPPLDGSVFPWLRTDIRHLALGRVSDGKRAKIRAEGGEAPDTIITVPLRDRHPAGFAMPRRYLLTPPRLGRCSLTGAEGLVFDAYDRWTQGLSYDSEGWSYPHVGPAEKIGPGGTVEKRWYIQAAAPLRLDDWLGPALGHQPQRTAEDGAGVVIQPPPVVRAFHARAETLFGFFDDRSGEISGLHPDLPFHIRAVALFAFGKAVGGLSEKTLPMYRLRSERLDQLATRAAAMAASVAHFAGLLRWAAGQALKLGDSGKTVSLPAQLHDALLRLLEDRVLQALPALAAALNHDDFEAGRITAEQTMVDLDDQARRQALDLFDDAFPIDGTSDLADRLVQVRRSLRKMLFAKQAKAGGS